jgi:hypothetical protein
VALQWILYVTYCSLLVVSLAVLAMTTFLEPASRRRELSWFFAWSVWAGLLIALSIDLLLHA